MKNFIRVLPIQHYEKQSFKNMCSVPWLSPSTHGYTLVFRTGEPAGQYLFNFVPASYFLYIDADIKKYFQQK